MTKSLLCLKPNDLCIIKECRDEQSYDKCSQLNCQGMYNYKCSLNSCAIDKETCVKYEGIKEIIASKQAIVPDVYYEKYKLFQSRIRNCSLDDAFRWKTDKLCGFKSQCFRKKVVHVMRGNLMTVSERVDCECNGKYGVKCGGDYCAISKMDCEELNFFNATAIKPCLKYY